MLVFWGKCFCARKTQSHWLHLSCYHTFVSPFSWKQTDIFGVNIGSNSFCWIPFLWFFRSIEYWFLFFCSDYWHYYPIWQSSLDLWRKRTPCSSFFFFNRSDSVSENESKRMNEKKEKKTLNKQTNKRKCQWKSKQQAIISIDRKIPTDLTNTFRSFSHTKYGFVLSANSFKWSLFIDNK